MRPFAAFTAIVAILLVSGAFIAASPAPADEAAVPWQMKPFSKVINEKEELESFENQINDWLKKNFGEITIRAIRQSNVGRLDVQVLIFYQRQPSNVAYGAKVFADVFNVLDYTEKKGDLADQVNTWFARNQKVITTVDVGQSITQLNSMYVTVLYKYGPAKRSD